MAHDAFISHSTKDKLAGDAVVAYLERAGIRCWAAPRDIVPGSSWAKSIVEAINQCKVMVVVFSTNANRSDHVRREIERAVNRSLPVVPVRIEDVLPQGDLEYFLSSSHWMDAISPPLENHFEELAKTLRRFLDVPRAPRPAKIPQVIPNKSVRVTENVEPKSDAPNISFMRKKSFRLAAAVVGILLVGILGVILFRNKPGKPSGPTVGAADTELKADIEAYEAQYRLGSTIPFYESKGPLRYRVWLQEAEKGDSMAQVFVGRCFEEGIVAKMDMAEAVKWYQKSADQGNSYAMVNLGIRYQNGNGGLPLDQEMAVHLFRAAAERNNVYAMAELGRMYQYGLGQLPIDANQAISWYTRAADLGDSYSMRRLAILYANGVKEIVKDETKSQQWYKKAAEAGDENSKGILASPPIVDIFQTYASPDATTDARNKALVRAMSSFSSLDSLSLEAALTVLSDNHIAMAMDQPVLKDAKDPLRQMREEVVNRVIELFRQSSRPMKNRLLEDYARVTSSDVVEWQKAGDNHRVVKFWEDSYKDISFATKTSGEKENVLSALRACILSLLATGNRPEAIRQLDDALTMSDAVLADRPWDWYLKDSTMGLCFDVAAILSDLGDQDRSQALLKRGWKIMLMMTDRSELLARYPVLPLKGMAPKGANETDKAYFSSFAPDAPKNNSFGMIRFTVSTDFSGKKYPFYVYIPHGKRGYVELQDQFRWVRDYRGGVIPKEVEDSFTRLNKIAADNNVDFADLSVYALGTESDSPTTKPAEKSEKRP